MLKIIIIIMLVFAVYLLFCSKKDNLNENLNSINKRFSCDEGTFYISGKKEEFIINKNNKFEFLVRDGQIIAYKDKKNNNAFTFYGGNE